MATVNSATPAESDNAKTEGQNMSTITKKLVQEHLDHLSFKRIFTVLVISICLLLTAQAQPARHRVVTARDIAQKAFPSVVVLIGEDKNGKPISLGSGFFVREDLIATTYHVINGASRVYAKIVGKEASYEISGIE